MASPGSERQLELTRWMPFSQYASSMSTLSYSDEYNAYERFLHCTTIPSVLHAIQSVKISAPLFPLLRRLTVTITRPGGWLDDLLPHIPSCQLQHLSIEYHASHSYPEGLLNLMLNLSDRTPSLCRLKLKLYDHCDPVRNAQRIDIFINSEKQRSLQVLFLDCAYLSPCTFSRIARFPCLRFLMIRLWETTMPELLSNSLSFNFLAKLDLRVTQAKLAISFFRCIGSAIPHVTHISISIDEVLPFDRDLGEISYQICRLCLPTSFKSLHILFKELAAEDSPPPLVPENPGYGLHMFQPLLDFSLRVLNLSVQLPLFPPTLIYVTQMASAWVNLISIRIDVGSIVPFDRRLLVPISKLVPFFQACKHLRQLYIPFRYLISDHLPSSGIQAYALLNLGLGWVTPNSRDAVALGQWLGIVAPGLPEIELVDTNGDTVVCGIDELTKFDTMVDGNSD